MLEVEVKVKVNSSFAKDKLVSLGFIEDVSLYERDVYFNSESNDLRKADKALRIRECRNLDLDITEYELNYKGAKIDNSTMTREETEFIIPSFSHGERLLNGLGYFAAGSVEKRRTHFVKDGITCCIDNVAGLGEFLEIEILADDESAYDEAIKKISVVLNSLNLEMEDTIRHSYLSMLDGQSK